MNLQTITKFASRTLLAGGGGTAALAWGDVPEAALPWAAGLAAVTTICFALVDAVKAWKGTNEKPAA